MLKAMRILSLPQAKLFEMLKMLSTLESWNQVTKVPCNNTESTSMDTQEVELWKN
jgi:hypothetical protein